jgi:outer membrane protein OmpA-like peptidoglycan-associated protein
MLRTTALLAGLAFAVTIAAPQAQAQSNASDIVRALTPSKPLTRSLSGKSRAIEIVPGKEAEILENKSLPKINLSIEFEYDSDRPTPVGQKEIATLGAALSDPQLKDFQFLLAGHTDARGSDEYNQRLSERRAAAVAAILAQAFKVDPARLKPKGFGESRLVDAANPDSPRNRRVEVVNLAQ